MVLLIVRVPFNRTLRVVDVRGVNLLIIHADLVEIALREVGVPVAGARRDLRTAILCQKEFLRLRGAIDGLGNLLALKLHGNHIAPGNVVVRIREVLDVLVLKSNALELLRVRELRLALLVLLLLLLELLNSLSSSIVRHCFPPLKSCI